MTYREAYDYGTSFLQEHEIAEAALNARLLLEFVCNTNRNDLLVHGGRMLSKEESCRYVNHITTRSKHVPLQYITETQEFMGLEFFVNSSVLIPRQDTEILVETLMKDLHEGMRILDLCTGSGCILLSLLHYSNDCIGVGADIATQALEVAQKNAERLGCKERATFVCSDLFEKIEGCFDILVSNPPYIKTSMIPTLMSEVRDYEPHLALDGKADGLFFYKKIIKEANTYLYGGGFLFFEIGFDQGKAVATLLENAGYADVQIQKDFAGMDRVVKGRKPCLTN